MTTEWKPPASNRRVLLVLGGLLAIVVAYTVIDNGGVTPAGSGASDTRSVRTVEGSGITASSPITLSGDYKVTWTASETDDDTPNVGCYHSARLVPVDGGGSEHLGSGDVSGTDSGTTNIYGLDSSSYYVDAASGCDWRIVFTPS